MKASFKLVLMIALVSFAGCRAPVEVQDEASRIFESGDARTAISVLERSESKDYIIGNFLAFLYMREQFYEKAPGGNREALEILRSVEVPVQNRRLTSVYLDLLRFDALANDGNVRGADQVMTNYCPQDMAPEDRRSCIRDRLAQVLLYLYQHPGHETRYYKELLAMTRAACMKAYGWDAVRPLSGEKRLGA